MTTKAELALYPLKENSMDLSRERILELYRNMVLSRRLDDREILLKRQQKIFFQISGAGHEAVLTVAGDLLRPGYDWFYPYYRDRALCLRLGITPEAMLLQAVGAADDPASGGRQMPSHWSDTERHVVSGSSPTGTQFLQAIGCADASRYKNRHPEVDDWIRQHGQSAPAAHHTDEVVFVSSGDGATSEGEFWESINAACHERLPVLFLVEDNGYAISVPVEVQTPGGSISRLLTAFPHLKIVECDGCDLFDSYAALSEAIAWCRSGEGPALVHAQVVRPYSHSLSDDERLYRTEEEREDEAQRDPIRRLRAWLLQHHMVSTEELKELEAEVDRIVVEAAERALAAPLPSPDDLYKYVYSPVIDPTSRQFESEPQFHGAAKTMVDLINACLQDEMRRDPRIIVYGEDVADCSRVQNLDRVKGKGGVFKVTAGLQRTFGGDRAWNAPIAEAAIVGRAIGMATRGLKPVPEIQFFDYIWPAMMQIRDELSVLRWRSNNGFAAPMVLRVPIGGYLTGGAIYHSQSGESIFTHMPGLRVVMPVDRAGCQRPVAHRPALRRSGAVSRTQTAVSRTLQSRAVSGAGLLHPVWPGQGGAGRWRPDRDYYGAVVQRALQAAQKLELEQGAQVEVLDLRSLAPYDWEAIVQSVRKTSRVLVAHEDVLSWGYGAEIAARIGEELFEDLDAPVRRVAAKDLYCAYQPELEDLILPQAADLYRAMAALLKY